VKGIIVRYRFFLILVLINIIIIIINPSLGQDSLRITWSNTIEMLSVVPPIFILLGLLDVWVKRETMIKYMGENSGWLGSALAFLLGSAAAGPLYAAFPVALVLLQKGSKLSNVFVFLGAWSTTKIPMLLFEASAMGINFMLIRFLIDIPGILIIAWITERLLKDAEKADIYQNALNRV
jgi:uncharacterized membrane protein YraQ (UPF0718 family)